MRVLVDTCVWSLALRRRSPVESPATEALRELISEGRAVMIGAVRQEILSGIKHLEQFHKLTSLLSAFPDESVLTSDYIEAARIANLCRASGIITGNTDNLIAALALTKEMEILTIDKDFEHISSIVPINLFLS